ncbi:MAG: UDP-N-acetylglucosamine 2-epimerase (non-hydrolyzing) [Bacteroidales bacterium]|nr:UDP-N-acetylglucosamine 2-epimerase (non-hydrolyzing) [Bacteroidales bacterium]
MDITIIAGARPNFIKIAPLVSALNSWNKQNTTKINYRLVHTGQHFDEKMSQSFFDDLNIPPPHINLNAGGGSQAEQTATIMIAFEKELEDHPAGLVIVVGDVTSTMACTIVAKKMNIKVAHIEGGIRSFDMSMPEEINRMVTDSISDYFFTTSKTANQNLSNLGIPKERIYFVGNIMIDTLLGNIDRFKKPLFFDRLGLPETSYFVLTMHRPANVDQTNILIEFLDTISAHVHNLPVIFPVHPRTAKTLEKLDFYRSNIYFVEPLSYLEFNYLVKNAKGVITDSGGITEETTVFGVPCMTLRDNTERPETIQLGTNVLVGTNPKHLIPYMKKLFSNDWKTSEIPELWDGNTAERIVAILSKLES